MPRPSASPSKALALGVVGPYLAVDLLEEGLAVLVLLLELAHLLKLLGGEALYPPGNLCDGQLVVVRGLERAKDGGAYLGLVGGLLGLTQDVLGPLGCLLGYPQALAGGLLGSPKPLPCYLLGCLEPLLGSTLEGPQALLGVGEGGKEVRVGPDPPPGKRPHALLLPADGTREGLGSARVLLGLLTHDLDGVTHPALHELGVALLELQELYAVGEELLVRPGVVLLHPHELESAFGEPDAAALGCREVLGKRVVGVALGLGHLVGSARRLVDVCGGSHQNTSMIVSACYYILITHISGVKP